MSQNINDLDNFRINNNEINSPGVFKAPGETVEIEGQTITGGLFYFGHDKNHQTDPSLVNPSLPIIRSSQRFYDDTLTDWTDYAQLSPQCRGAYITWLASNRDNPKVPLDYIYLYFYGLERRLLVDFINGAVSDNECQIIYDELVRLRTIYGQDPEFYDCATQLMEYLSVFVANITLIDGLGVNPSIDSLLFKYYLATTVNAGRPISPTLALIWLNAAPDHHLRTPARRCADEFSTLFKIRYGEKFDHGMIIKINKARLRLDYYTANESLPDAYSSKLDLPDPSALTGPINKLLTIAQSCTDELDSYSRYLGKKESTKEDLTGLLLLPSELLNDTRSSILNHFKSWATEQINTTDGVTDVASLWQNINQPMPERLYKKDLELLSCLCDKMGLSFAPDPRFHQAKPRVDGQIVLFNQHDHFKPTKAFNKMLVTLHLGAMMASADGVIDSSEIALLHRLIDDDQQLGDTEQKSLHAYLLWRLNTPINMTGLKEKLSHLRSQEKNAVSHILIGIALADGVIDPQEISHLEKFYTALGLDKTTVSDDIHRLSAIKSPPAQPEATAGFSLDQEVLAMHQSDTEAVQNMLGAIFNTDTDEKIDEDDKPVIAHPAGLDKAHQTLFDTLLSKNEWTRNELQQQCALLNLMLDGAIETINDWAYEHIDAPILEGEGQEGNSYIFVDREIVDEILALS